MSICDIKKNNTEKRNEYNFGCWGSQFYCLSNMKITKITGGIEQQKESIVC